MLHRAKLQRALELLNQRAETKKDLDKLDDLMLLDHATAVLRADTIRGLETTGIGVMQDRRMKGRAELTKLILNKQFAEKNI